MFHERVAPHELRWRLHPNGGRVACVAIPLDEAPRIIARGWLKVNGERAVIQAVFDDEPYNARLRIVFDRPYPEPHP